MIRNSINSAKTILIIEDNLDSRELYAEILRDEKFEVIETEHGTEALNYLKVHPEIPDLIIMDLTFPHMTALEFITGLKSQPQWENIPVLVVSGQIDTKEQSLRLKAKGYLHKPFDIDPFIKKVKTLIH